MSNRELSNPRTGKNVDDFKHALVDNLFYMRGQSPHMATMYDVYETLAFTVRDHLMQRWRKTVEKRLKVNPKTVYYLSAEYLLGRQLTQNLLYTETNELARKALADYNINIDDVIAMEAEPGLGNGGLGRLAACFLDSLATMDSPCVGYGIRYEFGIFKQSFQDGWQIESPDDWLFLGNPWEFAHPDDIVEVHFGGYTENFTGDDGLYQVNWIPGQTVLGEPYHMMVPGYKTNTVNMLRLWRARASQEFDFQLFDTGDYAQAVKQKVITENITKVLYPNDTTPQGRELRLKQQYFFVACSLQDIIRRFRVLNKDWDKFPDKAVIQLNDTHPVVAIPELMRILLDDYRLGWQKSWEITTRIFAYTCHTLLPEALEQWPVSLFGRLLPRHMDIIYEINRRFLEEVQMKFPDDPERIARMSLIEEGHEKRIRMAHLASVGSFSINGVAELHTELLMKNTLRDFAEIWPEKFNNKTNGVTQRRFVQMANPRLSRLITSKVGEGWMTDLDELMKLEAYANEEGFQQAWQEVKRKNKRDLAQFIYEETAVTVNPDSIFDVMVKRLHEYKRQLLKTLHIITLYQRIKANPEMHIVPRTFIFGAKAAPGYYMAKLIIKLINSVAEVVNHDADVNGRLNIIFLPNFNVTTAQKIYPAADISEQISMAGKEASGTGNMKFALNGALTVGTLDGANIEIRERVGPENFFLFGLTADEVFTLKANGYNPQVYYDQDEELKRAIDSIVAGDFSHGNQETFRPIIDSLWHRDEFLVFADYRAYIDAQEQAAATYQTQQKWVRMSILNAARCGYFSSDRTMRQYCEEIWQIEPVKVKI